MVFRNMIKSFQRNCIDDYSGTNPIEFNDAHSQVWSQDCSLKILQASDGKSCGSRRKLNIAA